MTLSKLALTDFRNFKDETFVFEKGINVVVGPNGSGKTNLLESIFLLASGKSFRARKNEEMVRHASEIARARAKVAENILEVVLVKGNLAQKTTPKRLLLNKVGKRLIDFAGNLKVVLFGPWDLSLILDSPSTRRHFLDTVLFQTDREYRRASLSYDKGLRQRNKLLWQIREENVPRSSLTFWNQLLVKNGDYISQKRAEFIDFANTTSPLNKEIFALEYDKNAISETRLAQYAQKEVAAAMTLVGPHRDDFIFRFGAKLRDLSKYGSRGEQRMGVLWLKLAELLFIKKEIKEEPVLLLDDIFSELDAKHRRQVMDIATSQQTLITTADPHLVVDLKANSRIDLGQ